MVYVFPLKKLEKRSEQVLPGSEGVLRGEGGVGCRGKNRVNNVSTCEYMNKNFLKKEKHFI
jgi:hypothetical protein